MNKLFEQINKIRFAVTGNPLSEKDIITYQKKMTEDGYSPLPQDVITFLKKHNGFLLEGRCLWGINTQKGYRFDILSENNLVEVPNFEDMTLLGSTETTYVAWNKSTNSYSMVDNNDFSVIHEFDNFQNAVRYLLKIDD